ncbi:MAG: anti-sigma regulatory factor [Verrucomicrobia bacterium]|nr:MAG: anti-sigma regulatory factor [Verrucomicrobiota bacterium]
MSPSNEELSVPIKSAADIVVARQKGRALAIQLGFAGSDPTVIAAAISEVARNIVNHAQHGEIVLSGVHENSRNGIQVIASDQGPGISDIDRAMQYGYSSSRGMGVGLPGAKWLMDEFDIESQLGKGTRVTMRKWVR